MGRNGGTAILDEQVNFRKQQISIAFSNELEQFILVCCVFAEQQRDAEHENRVCHFYVEPEIVDNQRTEEGGDVAFVKEILGFSDAFRVLFLCEVPLLNVLLENGTLSLDEIC